MSETTAFRWLGLMLHYIVAANIISAAALVEGLSLVLIQPELQSSAKDLLQQAANLKAIISSSDIFGHLDFPSENVSLVSIDTDSSGSSKKLVLLRDLAEDANSNQQDFPVEPRGIVVRAAVRSQGGESVLLDLSNQVSL